MRGIYTTIGASNHSGDERAEDDFYATDPEAIRKLLEVESFSFQIWECACGQGHIAEVLKEGCKHDVRTSDIVDRGYPNTEIVDFLKETEENTLFDIITNPPYKYAREFVSKALEITPKGHKIAMLLKLTFLEGKKRRKLFETHPPVRVWVFSNRIKCAKDGRFDAAGRSAICYAWFVWKKGYKGHPEVRWI